MKGFSILVVNSEWKEPLEFHCDEEDSIWLYKELCKIRQVELIQRFAKRKNGWKLVEERKF